MRKPILMELPQPTYSPAQVAELANVHIATVYRWIKEGRIQVIRFGRLIRIPCEEVNRLIREGFKR